MKEKNKSLFWILLVFCTLGLYAPVAAQDDLYYDPATDAPAQTVRTNNDSDDSEYREPSNITRRYDNDDQYYDEDDDYAYQYSSRIRRFHRPSRVIDYYDPFFVDLYYYDPFFMPGNSIYTYGYNDYWTWRQWRRAQRWNSWYSWGIGPVWSSWGWNSCYSGFNAWNNPWAMNNFYYDPYWTMNGFNPYYGNNWVNNNYYYSNNNGNPSGYQPKTYTGVRRHGSTVNTGYARIAESNGGLGRLTAKTDGPVLENRSNRTPTRNLESPRSLGTPTDRNGVSENVGRRTDDRTNAPTAKDGRNVDRPETQPSRETSPRRSEAETRPSRTETPTRRSEPETRPSRTETPTRRSEPETRPSRTEERPRSYDRPSRTEERSRSNDTPTRTQESRPSRNESSSPRTFDSGSSRSSSPGSSSGGSSGGGGRSSGGSSGGGSRGRN